MNTATVPSWEFLLTAGFLVAAGFLFLSVLAQGHRRAVETQRERAAAESRARAKAQPPADTSD